MKYSNIQLKYHRDYYKKNREKILRRKKVYNSLHRDERNLKQRTRNKINKVKIKKHNKLYYQINREKLKIAQLNRSKSYRENGTYRSRHFKWALKKRYGITTDKFMCLLSAQDYKCKICQKEETIDRHLCVDHDHNTGQIRGILCTSCNAMLGFAKDRIDILENGIKYLQK